MSYRYRKLMGISVEAYDATPALTVEWDLQMHEIEMKIERRKEKQ